MSTNKKKIASVFFILLGISPLLIAFFISLQKDEIHRKMKKKFEVENLQIVMLPETEVTWMSKHEIWLNNSMFDIVSKKLENGIYIFAGLYDNEETDLVNKEKKTSEKNNEQQELLSQLLEDLPAFCTSTGNNHEIINIILVFYSFISEYYKNPLKVILVPPPQFYC